MIGLFDSGIGGLALFSQIERLFPLESIYYLADTAHFPYGEKTREQIIHYSLQNAAHLMEKRVKIIVIACFTASAIAYEAVSSVANVPVISIIESMVQELLSLNNSSRVAILGTKRTIESGAIQNRLPQDWTLFPLVASDLINAIEKGEECYSTLLSYRDFFEEQQIDTVALACTHFTHILPMMQECFGNRNIVEASAAAASQVASRIELSTVKMPHQFFATGEPIRMGLPFSICNTP